MCLCLYLASAICAQPTAETASDAKTGDNTYIRWREHIIDDPERGGVAISGSDGLEMADLDGDGFEDIVSVHESDTVYDGVAEGHVRIAFGSEDSDSWVLTTLSSGAEVGAAEDVAIADADADGDLDIIIACELAHLIYFENPGKEQRTRPWKRVIPAATLNRGSFIRVFFEDFDGDGKPEVSTANKGEQNPDPSTDQLNNLSLFHLPANPLNGDEWREQILGQVHIPINAQPVDLDQDGDMDVIGGSRGERRIMWFENLGSMHFTEHPINASGSAAEINNLMLWINSKLTGTPAITGFNMAFADMNADKRLDIVINEWTSYVVWLEQPANILDEWRVHPIGSIYPDHLVSVTLADINQDGHLDVFTGSYSRGPRDHDGESIDVDDPLGRIAWFENPGDTRKQWIRHDISRRVRGMFDKFIARDMDRDGDVDFVGTRGNSEPYDGVFWLEQIRSPEPGRRFIPARKLDSREVALP